MKTIIAIVMIFLFVSECNADIRVLEQLTSKHNIKHKSVASKSIMPKVKTKSHGLKHKKVKQKNATENWASKGVKHKEIVTSEDLDIRNDIAYLPNQNKPFTGKYQEYHSSISKQDVKNNNSNVSSNAESQNKKYLEITYKDGKKNGPITMWDENGVKIGAIYFKDGMLID